jgi:tRNA pseudouridine55 synthase
VKPPPAHGLIVLDKPSSVTSRAVVDRAQGWFSRGTRLGHAGTLDPLATGVLVLCVGAATRLVEYVQRMGKTYRAAFLMGARSTTDDADGSIEAVAVRQPPSRAEITACLQEFIGEIEQVPPAHSAAKLAGRRAYELARRGQHVVLEPRPVRIDAIDLLDYEYPHLEVVVHCGKGTYIRSLARDLGERLGCGALVEKLRRTRIGPFEVARALTPEADIAAAHASLLPVALAVAELPRRTLAPEGVQRLRRGQEVSLAGSLLSADSFTAPEVAVFDEAGTFVAVAIVDRQKQVLRPEKVLPAGIQG